VTKLTDYLDQTTLSELQQAFSGAAGAAVRICSPDGRPVLETSTEAGAGRAPGQQLGAPITLDGAVIGSVRLGGAAPHGRPEELLALMAEMLRRLCQGESRLRARAKELAALFSLTSEFTGPRELQGVLDQVTRTVVQAMRAKACTIRLLSDDRTELLIRSAAGVSPEYLNKGPILVSQSVIDREVLETGKPVYIADQRSDPRVLYPAEARQEGIVSALCAPLTYKGRAEGVIRMYTGEPHVFDWFETAMLESIASQAAAAIVNARLRQDAVEAAGIRRQLKIAGEVQQRLIPAAAPSVAGLDIGALYVPCYELGGDFYDFIDLPPDNLGVGVCDVSGKGVPASLLMASVRASLRAHAVNIYDMSTVLSRVNRDLCADTLTSEFATLFYGVIDYRTRRFTYANAGHVPPILVRGGQCCPLATGGGVLGVLPDGYWGHEHFTLQSGDVLVGCTDGLTEALDHNDEPFGRQRLEAAALEAIADGRQAEGIAHHVLWVMRRFTGLQTALDDLTLVVIKVQ